MTKEAKHKNNFRKSSKWKNWRKYLKSKRKVDEVTGSPLYKGWQCHHLCMLDSEYEILKEDRFSCLNRKTHDVIHWLFRYTNWREILKKLESILERMEQLNNRNTEYVDDERISSTDVEDTRIIDEKIRR